MNKNSINCNKLLIAILLLQITTTSQAMYRPKEECLSDHILNYDKRSAQTSILRHSPVSLNNSFNFKNQRLPLNTAISIGDIDIITELLNKGANPNARDQAGSPLQEAAKIGNVFIMEMLVHKGAKFDQATLDLALKTVEEKRSRLLWPGVDFSSMQTNKPEERVRIIGTAIKKLADI